MDAASPNNYGETELNDMVSRPQVVPQERVRIQHEDEPRTISPPLSQCKKYRAGVFWRRNGPFFSLVQKSVCDIL